METQRKREKHLRVDVIRKEGKSRRYRLLFAIFLGALLACFFYYSDTHKEELKNKDLYTLSYAPDNTSDAEKIWMENDTEYKSVIEFDHYGELTGVRFWIKKVPSDFNGDLLLRVYDGGGEEKVSAYITSADLQANTDDYVSVWGMNVPVSKGDKFWISMMVTGNTGGSTCLYLFDDENGEVILNGDYAVGKSLRQNGYIYITYRWTIVLAALISVCVVLMLCFDNTVVRYIYRGVMALLPLLVLFLWLVANSNLEFIHNNNIFGELGGYTYFGAWLYAFFDSGTVVFCILELDLSLRLLITT